MILGLTGSVSPIKIGAVRRIEIFRQVLVAEREARFDAILVCHVNDCGFRHVAFLIGALGGQKVAA